MAQDRSSDPFPRRSARTRRFTLGAPRSFAISAEGDRVWFLRSDHGTDPVHSLWLFDVATQTEHRRLDPRAFGTADLTALPAAERARRERARESGEGIVAFAIDRDGRQAVGAVGGQVVIVGVDTEPVALNAVAGAFDPRLDPTGQRVAYVADGALRVVGVDEADRMLIGEEAGRGAGDDGHLVSWGAAEFIAAEEFSRSRGYWWSPDGERLLVERVDESPVAEWHIAAPIEPWTEPRAVRYPAAGTANADCALAVVGLDGSRVDVQWDTETYPYLLTASWSAESPPTISVLSRDQRTMSIQTVDPDSGQVSEVARRTDEHWVEPVGGAPVWHQGRLVTVFDDWSSGDDDAAPDARRVFVDGAPLSPTDLQVRSVVNVDDDGVVVAASGADPTEIEIVRVSWAGSVEPVTPGPGVHAAVAAGSTMVITSAAMDQAGSTTRVLSAEAEWAAAPTIESHAEPHGLDLNVKFLELGARRLASALVMPSAAADPGGSLPVLLDPYGGPHAQRVLRSQGALAASQWLADQGFAVLVVDGRGTPGRGPAWERSVRGDLAAPVLEDQIDALHAAAEVEARLDLRRVGIRGWSFGGYLAALAVLARPDVFHAAVAGAPVTDWRLYDTGYTERYLGLPQDEPANYERTDLTPLAQNLRRPLMLIHGLADDNVVAAHTLQLSRALLEAGRPHTVLPLSGVTHMTPQEEVAENLLILQVEFLKQALAAEAV